MNATLQAIASCYSCRAFTDRKPSRADLETIATAAVQAPSAMNRQAWHVTVLTDTALIREMDGVGMAALAAMEDKATYNRFMERGGTLFYNAPVMMVVSMQPDTELDAGILCENIAIAAKSMGIESLICGMARIPLEGEKGAHFVQRLGFPKGYEFGIAVLLGYPQQEGGTPHPADMGKVHFVD